MIKRLKINQYRKLKNIEINFTKGLNVLSGTNGTCKTSLLHLISNSFQTVKTTCDWVEDNNSLKVLKTLNAVVNPKVESLTRGDKAYNDPAHNVKGVLFDVEYFDHSILGFRRHNSELNSRYALKPKYQTNTKDRLPFCPVVYLGLPRLIPYGEFNNDDAISKVRNTLPKEYQKELEALYKDFTRYEIEPIELQQLGDVKIRTEFSSNQEGIDSNTISAGEDNLYIILSSLISLKYYYESIKSNNMVESILLIDEFDATLHPAFQIKLLRIFKEFSENYKIQIVFTSHSMSTLEYMLRTHENVIYLVDNITDVVKMEQPDIYKIQMHLSSLTQEDMYLDKVVPVFSEDEETRDLLNLMIDYFEENKPEFQGVRRFLYFVNVNLGADSLIGIFKDIKLLRTTMKAICVLDGDHETDLTNNIVALPGYNKGKKGNGLSPENLLFEYAQFLYESNDGFWIDPFILEKGYGKVFYYDNIYKAIDNYKREKEEGATSKKEREFNKELYRKYRKFFILLFKHWLNNEDNRQAKYEFYKSFRQAFRNNATCNGINPEVWK